MPKRSEYRQGTPNWVDLQTTDQSAAKKFYTSLFGWGYDDNPVPGGGGVYSMATLNGEAVAAIAPMPPGAPEGMPPIWNTYIAVDDVDAVVDKVVPGGGQVMMPAFDIGDAGRMSFITDPTGAAVGLWQANRHIGATLVNETGTLIWNELLTDKPDLALAFYEAVVGLTHSSMEIAAGQNYRVLKAGTRKSAAVWNRRCPACRIIGTSTLRWMTPTPRRPKPPQRAARSLRNRLTFRRWAGSPCCPIRRARSSVC